MDGLLPEGALCAMRAHRDDCPACSRHDVLIRRSLMALQALPRIEPSADFRVRLFARIARDDVDGPAVGPRGVRWGIAGAVIAASAALLLVASSVQRSVSPVRLTPVLARAPEPPAIALPRQSLPLAAVVAAVEPRFEALGGTSVLRRAPAAARGSVIRLQLASYPGQ